MSKQNIILDLQGLYINNNPLSQTTAPPGTLKEALNTVITKQGIIESRRGFTKMNDSLVGSDIQAMFEFKKIKLIHSDNDLFSDVSGTGVYTSIATAINAPDTDHKIKAVQANNNFYFTSDEGIRKLETTDGSIPVKKAGVPKALNGTATLTFSGATWLTAQRNVAYRAVIGYKDSNNNLLLSAPSQRLVVSNTDATLASFVNLRFNLPDDLTTDYFFQIYRSTMSVDINTEPNDELKLAVEQAITSTDISNKYITLTDKTLESLLGVSLYTNQSQEGIENSNEILPFAKDICQYKNFSLYANTENIGRATFSFLGVGSGTGFDIADSITISSNVYYGATGNVSALNQFKVVTTGTPASNIQETALNFIEIVNSSSTNTTHYAFYTSSVDDLPGKVTIETRKVGQTPISITASKVGVFQPELYNTSITTDSNKAVNRVFFSKAGQAEAVPIYQYLDVGSSNFPIQRIIALRDSVYIFKETEGIFTITGTDFSSFRSTLFDSSTKLKAIESAITFNNLIFAYTDQGVISVSDSGVSVISQDIESPLVKLLANDNISKAFGVGYDSERSYLLFIPEKASDTYCNIAYVYNSFTNTFTTWKLGNIKAGILDKDENKLYFATSDNTILQERKAYTEYDFYDKEYEVNLVSFSDYDIVLDDIPSDIEVGYSIYQNSRKALITAIDVVTNTITVDKLFTGWNVASIKIVEPILVRIALNPITGNDPGTIKHFLESTFLFNTPNFNSITVGHNSNFDLTYVKTDLSSTSTGGFGENPFGLSVWGGVPISSISLRTLFPKNATRGLWSSIQIESNQAFNSFSLMGISILFSDVSERFK